MYGKQGSAALSAAYGNHFSTTIGVTKLIDRTDSSFNTIDVSDSEKANTEARVLELTSVAMVGRRGYRQTFNKMSVDDGVASVNVPRVRPLPPDRR